MGWAEEMERVRGTRILHAVLAVDKHGRLHTSVSLAVVLSTVCACSSHHPQSEVVEEVVRVLRDELFLLLLQVDPHLQQSKARGLVCRVLP